MANPSKPTKKISEKPASEDTPLANQPYFAQWAPTDLSLLVEGQENILALRVAELVAEYVQVQTLEVVDVGCGSGAIGRILGDLTPQLSVDGIDISKEMLAVAESIQRSDGSPCYRELLDVDLRQPIYFAANHYDLLVSSGLFAHGALGASDLVALVQSLKARGQVFVSIEKDHFKNAAFQAVLLQAVWDKLITEPIYTEVDIYNPSSDQFGKKAIIAHFSKVPTLNDL